MVGSAANAASGRPVGSAGTPSCHGGWSHAQVPAGHRCRLLRRDPGPAGRLRDGQEDEEQPDQERAGQERLADHRRQRHRRRQERRRGRLDHQRGHPRLPGDGEGQGRERQRQVQRLGRRRRALPHEARAEPEERQRPRRVRGRRHLAGRDGQRRLRQAARPGRRAERGQLGRLVADLQDRAAEHDLPGQALRHPERHGRARPLLQQEAVRPGRAAGRLAADVVGRHPQRRRASSRRSRASTRSRSTPARRWARPPPRRASCRCWPAPASRSTTRPAASGRARPPASPRC